MYENMTNFLGRCSSDKLVPFYSVLGKVEATYLTCFSWRPITPIYNFFPVISIIMGILKNLIPTSLALLLQLATLQVIIVRFFNKLSGWCLFNEAVDVYFVFTGLWLNSLDWWMKPRTNVMRSKLLPYNFIRCTAWHILHKCSYEVWWLCTKK